MALTLSIETTFGVTCSQAHAVILEFRLVKSILDNGSKSFVVKYGGLIYADATAYTSDKQPISRFDFELPLDVTDGADQENIVKQCYLHLKTQSGFTDAIDA